MYNFICIAKNITLGFFVGKEGPMIHSGAIIGAGLPQVITKLFDNKFSVQLKVIRIYTKSGYLIA